MMGFDDRSGKKKLITNELHNNHEYNSKMAQFAPETTHHEKHDDGTHHKHKVVGDKSGHHYSHHSSQELAQHHAGVHNESLPENYKGK